MQQSEHAENTETRHPAEQPAQASAADGQNYEGLAPQFARPNGLNPRQNAILTIQRTYGNTVARRVVAQLRAQNARVIQRQPEANVVTDLNARAAAKDVPGYLQVLRTENGAQAASAAVRGAISAHLGTSKLTQKQVWQAVCLQVLGTEANWEPTIKNFVNGVVGGQFVPPAGMPPASADELRQTAIQTANKAAAGDAGFELYRGQFDGLWFSAPFAAMSSDFDEALPSRGPRSERAQEVFKHLYASSAAIKTAYDTNADIRIRIDEYLGPDALNLNASPHLQKLRAVFKAQAAIAAAAINNPAYVAFKAKVEAVARDLDANELDAFKSSHEWRLVIDRTVTAPVLRDDLTQTIKNAWMGAPAGGAAAVPAAGPAGGPAAALALTPDQQTFVNDLSLPAPAPIKSDKPTEQLTFKPASSRDPAGLNVSSRVEVTPAGQVQDGQQTEHPWPAAAKDGAPHQATVQVEGGAAGFTDFEGSLTLVPAAGVIAHPPVKTQVKVTDNRLFFFNHNVKHGLIFTDQNTRFLWSPGDTVKYFGGQQALSVAPQLPAANPGLTVFMQGHFTRNGVALPPFPRTEFGSDAQTAHLGGTTVLEEDPPSPDPTHMELEVEFFLSMDPAALRIHHLNQAFDILPGGAFDNDAVLHQAEADHDQLNSPDAGGILDQMTHAGGQKARIAEAVHNGTIKIEPMLLRADSAEYIRAHPALGNPRDHVAYLMGHTAVDDAHTLVAQPGADAWRWGAFPDSIFINLTPTLDDPAAKRPDAKIIDNINHESVHVLDFRLNAGSDIERYKTEFRAYWMDGTFDGESTAFDPKMDNVGPKTHKARAIFRHLYRNPTYDYVEDDYDKNVDHFREQVDNYLVPDGINLIVSVRLEALRDKIEHYGGAGFAAHKGEVQALFDHCDGDDKGQIVGNRAWRDLVERKYAGGQRAEIKGILKIP